MLENLCEGAAPLTEQLVSLERSLLPPIYVNSYAEYKESVEDALRDPAPGEITFTGAANGTDNQRRLQVGSPHFDSAKTKLGKLAQHKVVFGPIEEELRGGSEFRMLFRPDDFVIPICHDGMNRSQVLYVLLNSLKRGHVTPGKENVSVPHGAESGFDPYQAYENITPDNIIWYLHGKMLPRGSPGEWLHDCFFNAFGVEKRRRIGQRYCESQGLELNPIDGSSNPDYYPAVEKARKQQRAYMDRLLYDPDNLRSYTGPHGRVIVFAFCRAPSIFLDRILKVNATNGKRFNNVIVVAIPLLDNISRAGRAEDLAKYRETHGREITRDALNTLRQQETYQLYASFLRMLVLQGSGSGGPPRSPVPKPTTSTTTVMSNDQGRVLGGGWQGEENAAIDDFLQQAVAEACRRKTDLLSRNMREANAKEAELMQRLVEMEGSLTAMSTEVNNCYTAIERQAKDNEDLQQKLTGTENTLASTVQQLLDKTQESMALSQENERLRKELDDAMAAISAQSKRVTAMQSPAEFHALQASCVELSQEFRRKCGYDDTRPLTGELRVPLLGNRVLSQPDDYSALARPLNKLADGNFQGAMSIVFLINFTPTFLEGYPELQPVLARHSHPDSSVAVLKMLTHYDSDVGDRTTVLKRNYAQEYEFPLLLPEHPGIIQVLGAYHGPTAPFAQHCTVKLAPRTAFVVMPKYAGTLASWIEDQCRRSGSGAGVTVTSPTIVIPQRVWQRLLLCLLDTAAFLRANFIAHRDLKSDNVFMTAAGRPVIADFGGGLKLKDPPEVGVVGDGWANIPFGDKSQAYCCNGMAWDPHIYRLSQSGPRDQSRRRVDMTLEDVYDKSDLFAIGRMIYDVCGLPREAFPTTSGGVYSDDMIPELPREWSYDFRAVVRSLVLDDVKHRPTAAEAWRMLAVLCFVPWDACATADTCSQWLLEERVKILSTRGPTGDEHALEFEQRLQYVSTATPTSLMEDRERLKRYIEVATKQAECETLSRELDDAKATITKRERDIAQLKASVQMLEQEMATLESHVTKRNNSLAAKQAEHDGLSELRTNLEFEMQNVSEEKRNAEARVQELEHSLETALEEVLALHARLNESAEESTYRIREEQEKSRKQQDEAQLEIQELKRVIEESNRVIAEVKAQLDTDNVTVTPNTASDAVTTTNYSVVNSNRDSPATSTSVLTPPTTTTVIRTTTFPASSNVVTTPIVGPVPREDDDDSKTTVTVSPPRLPPSPFLGGMSGDRVVPDVPSNGPSDFKSDFSKESVRTKGKGIEVKDQSAIRTSNGKEEEFAAGFVVVSTPAGNGEDSKSGDSTPSTQTTGGDGGSVCDDGGGSVCDDGGEAITTASDRYQTGRTGRGRGSAMNTVTSTGSISTRSRTTAYRK